MNVSFTYFKYFFLAVVLGCFIIPSALTPAALAAADHAALSSAFILDNNEDITLETATQDGVYADVPANATIRVTFDQPLSSKNDITLYGFAANQAQPSNIEVYPVYRDQEGRQAEGDILISERDGGLPTFENIGTYGKYKILLKNLSVSTDTFDLKVRGGGLKVDYVVDPSFTILHTFLGGTTDGTNPNGSLILSGSTFYGVTLVGGANSKGIIFSVNTDGSSFTDLHDFTGSTFGGDSSYGALVLSGSTLYGMSSNGGSLGYGIIFSIGTNGSSFTNLHDFTSSSTDGANPSGALNVSGSTLYGMTRLGGSSNKGIIFSMATNGSSFTDLHDFTGTSTDGSQPYGSMILSSSTLYGMTSLGGASNKGVIFSMQTNGTGFTDLHDFAGTSTDGSTPVYGNLTLSGSTLYGMTSAGGSSNKGIIFSMATNGSSFTDLHDFTGTSTDGQGPYGSVTVSGSTLYGMARFGGTSIANGIIFSMATNGSGFTDLHDFVAGSSDGGNPIGSLLLSGSTLYGMTRLGGSLNRGVLFSFPGPAAAPADAYWVGGSGNWSDAANHWATSSGGSPGSGNLPDSTSNVHFDSSSGTGTVTVDSSVTVVDFSNSSGNITVSPGSNSITVSGTFNNSAGLFTGGTSTVSLTSTGSKNLTASGISFYNLTISGSGGTQALQSALAVSNNLTISAGTLDASASNCSSASCNVTVGKNFSNSGTFTAQTGTVTFNGTTQAVTGANTFYNLTLGGPDTVTFPSSVTQTITNTLSCTGSSGHVITINSSSSGVAATLSKSSGTVSCDYLSLQDSTATGGAVWQAGANSASVSGNSGWLFDTTAPTTTPTAGSYTFNTNSTGNVTVTLTCSDGVGSGCAATYYCADINNSCTPTTAYTVPFTVSQGGISYIRYYSVDTSANTESVGSKTIVITIGSGGGGGAGSSGYTPSSSSSIIPPPAVTQQPDSAVTASQIVIDISTVTQQIRSLIAAPPSPAIRTQLIALITQEIQILIERIKALVGK